MSTKKATKSSKPKKPAARTRQRPAVKRAAKAKAAARPRDPNAPTVGTTLARPFKGADITVMVTADGFEFDRQTFRSLSALARHITGYAISGPVFFRLIEPKVAAKQEAQP